MVERHEGHQHQVIATPQLPWKCRGVLSLGAAAVLRHQHSLEYMKHSNRTNRNCCKSATSTFTPENETAGVKIVICSKIHAVTCCQRYTTEQHLSLSIELLFKTQLLHVAFLAHHVWLPVTLALLRPLSTCCFCLQDAMQSFIHKPVICPCKHVTCNAL